MKLVTWRVNTPSVTVATATALLMATGVPSLATAQQSTPAPSPATPEIVVNVTESTPPRQGSAENGYRVDAVNSLGPLGNAKLLNLPYSIQIMPAALIDNVQAQSFKDVMKYMPLVQFQEQQGSEVLRPATRGMMGSNFQNSRMDGMTIFVTGGNPVELFQQIEVLNGPSSAIYGPSNPAGTFNFVTKRPNGTTFQDVTLAYDSSTIFTGHADIGGHFGANADGADMFGYRINLLGANGTAYVNDSELTRKLGSLAFDIRPVRGTTIELNYFDYEVQQEGYPGWFTYGQKTVLPGAPDPTRQGYGQSYAGVDLTTKLGSGRWLQDLGGSWRLVLGGLYQVVDRNINTPVNNLTSNAGDYTSSLANGFAPRFQITSNIGYLNGTFRTGTVDHDLTIGTTGYRAVTNSVVTPATPASVLLGSANIDDPRQFPEPAGGLPDISNQYHSNVSYQQGINLSDTLTFTPEWAARLAVSQDWIRSQNYSNKSAPTTLYTASGASPTASLLYKPRADMTAYVTYASSLQQGDLAPAGSTNANQSLAPYRSEQWEGGFKWALPGLDLSTAIFRLERPFANVDPVDNTFKISGNQVNYGVEFMAIGAITDTLTAYAGLTALDPKLEDTGNPATDGKQYVGMPKLRSNVLLEYRAPTAPGFVFVFDWQYAARRPVNDANSQFSPSYSTFDVGVRYAAPIGGKLTTWRVAVNNVTDKAYWSTIGPSNITGTGLGNMTAHLGAPRTVLASVTVAF